MILITGGSGFVGRHLVKYCAAEALPVRVLSRRPAPSALPPGVTWYQADFGDATNRTDVRAALDGVETVVHAAARLPATGATPAEFHRVNVDGTRTLARLAREASVARFMLISSVGVYGGTATPPYTETDETAPVDVYARTKLAGEHAMISVFDGSNVRWTILRPPGLYAGDRRETAIFFRTVATRKVWLHGPTRVVLQPTHVSDVVRAALSVSCRDDLGGTVLNIGGDRILAYQEFIALVGERVGHTPLQISAPKFRTTDRTVNIAQARTRIAFEPMALERGLDETVAELRRMGQL